MTVLPTDCHHVEFRTHVRDLGYFVGVGIQGHTNRGLVRHALGKHLDHPATAEDLTAVEAEMRPRLLSWFEEITAHHQGVSP